MEKILITLVDAIIVGGPLAIISLLLLFIVFLVWDRTNLIKSKDMASTEYKKDLQVVLDKYYQGHINLIDAFNELKVILAKLEGKL
jgi:hypothetical protein